jgi:guanylate kinase
MGFRAATLGASEESSAAKVCGCLLLPLTRAEKRAAHLHVVNVVLNEDNDGALARALRHSGSEDIHRLVAMSPTEVASLAVPADGTDPEAPLDPGHRQMITCLQALALHRSGSNDPISDWAAVTQGECDDFRVGPHCCRFRALVLNPLGNSACNPGSAQGNATGFTTAARPKDPLHDFAKGIKRDQSPLPENKDDEFFDNWQRTFEAQAKAQGVSQVVDPNCAPPPGDKPLFDKMQELTCAVFVAKLQSDKGKEPVKAHKGDAQKICNEHRKRCLQSTGADISAGGIMEHTTAARLGSAPWNGTAHSFVLHFVEQMRLHNTLAGSADQIPEGMKCTTLKKAVFNHGELSAVDNMNKVLAAQTGKPATCESHRALLLSTALQVDGKLKHEGRDPKRQANFADACGFVDGLADLPECGIGTSIFGMLAAHKTQQHRDRVSGAQWHALPAADQQKWDTFSSNAKAIILGTKKPGKASAFMPTAKVDAKLLTSGWRAAKHPCGQAVGHLSAVVSQQRNSCSCPKLFLSPRVVLAKGLCCRKEVETVEREKRGRDRQPEILAEVIHMMWMTSAEEVRARREPAWPERACVARESRQGNLKSVRIYSPFRDASARARVATTSMLRLCVGALLIGWGNPAIGAVLKKVLTFDMKRQPVVLRWLFCSVALFSSIGGAFLSPSVSSRRRDVYRSITEISSLKSSSEGSVPVAQTASKKNPLHPQVGDVVRYYDLDGGREDGQVLVGRVSFIQKNLGQEGSGWLLELAELEDVGDGYYADYPQRKRMSKKSVRDAGRVSPIAASFVRSENAWKVPVDSATGIPRVRAERYDVDDYAGPFSGPNEIDQTVLDADAAIYGALKGKLLRYVAIAGLAGTLVTDLVKGTEDAIIYAAGAGASLGYLFFLTVKTDTVASPDSKLGNNVANLRFLMPLPVLIGIAFYNKSLGDANPVQGQGPFATITVEQFAAAILGFLTYRIPLFLSQLQDAFKDESGDMVLPGSAGVAMQIAKEKTKDVVPNAFSAELETVLLVSGPQATGRSELVQRLIQEGEGRYIAPNTVDRVKDSVKFERLESRDEFLAVDPSGRYGTTKEGILTAARESGPDSVVVVDADVELARKLTNVPGIRLVGVWVGLNSVEDFEERLEVQIDTGKIAVPQDETREGVKKARIREIVQEIEYGISSGVFEFTILNTDEESSLKQLREAASYCFK